MFFYQVNIPEKVKEMGFKTLNHKDLPLRHEDVCSCPSQHPEQPPRDSVRRSAVGYSPSESIHIIAKLTWPKQPVYIFEYVKVTAYKFGSV